MKLSNKNSEPILPSHTSANIRHTLKSNSQTHFATNTPCTEMAAMLALVKSISSPLGAFLQVDYTLIVFRILRGFFCPGVKYCVDAKCEKGGAKCEKSDAKYPDIHFSCFAFLEHFHIFHNKCIGSLKMLP